MSEYERALNALYLRLIGREPVNTDTGRYIIEEIKCDWWTVDKFIDDLEKLFTDKPFLLDAMKQQMRSGCYKEIYLDSATLLVYYMLKRKPKRLFNDWPLSKRALANYAVDLGISLESW
jgi:hypothetical protein